MCGSEKNWVDLDVSNSILCLSAGATANCYSHHENPQISTDNPLTTSSVCGAGSVGSFDPLVTSAPSSRPHFDIVYMVSPAGHYNLRAVSLVDAGWSVVCRVYVRQKKY